MTPPRGHYLIGELCEAFGVTLRTLRFYEDEGLLHPTRAGQRRLYSDDDRDRLSEIVGLRRVGFSISEIGELLAARALDDETRGALALSKFRRQIERLSGRRREIDEAIKTLEAACGRLEGAAPQPAMPQALSARAR